MWYLYFLYSSSSDKYYIGISERPYQRENEHNGERNRGWTRHHIPWELRAIWEAGEQGQARIIERFIKKQKSRRLIERMIAGEELTGMLAQLVRVPHVRD